MALPNKEKYEQKKIDSLLHYLKLYQQKGQPIDYEILVDGFKAVRRTNDPDMFSMFENFVNADTRAIEVLLFTGSSNNNEKRIFYFGEAEKGGLAGIDVKTMVDDEVQRKLKEKEYETLKSENRDLQEKVANLETELVELEKENDVLKTKQSPLNSFLGDIGSSLVESFIKRNPKVMSAFPGGDALAGLLQSGTEEPETSRESEVTFAPKSGDSPVSEEDQAAIHFVNQLKAQFTKTEFDQVLAILQHLADDKGRISDVLARIESKQQKP